MKKITLLLGLAFLGFSCSSDDDGGSSVSTADLIGEWRLISETEDGEEIVLDNCELMTTFTFTETELSEENYRTSGLTSECFSFSSDNIYAVEGNVLSTIEEFDGVSEDIFIGEISVSDNELTIDDEETFAGEFFGSVRVFERVTE